MVTDLASSVLKVDRLIEKYASIASIHWMVSSDSPEKCSGRAALILAVLVVVDMRFVDGGFTGVCWPRGTVVDIMDVTEGFRVVKGVTGGKEFVVGVMVRELGGKGVAHLGGEGKDAGLVVYC